MSNQAAHLFHTLPAAGDLSASYGCMLIINSSGKAALAGANASAGIGVSQDKPSVVDQSAPYQHTGLAEVKFGGVTAIGDLLTTDASGRFVLATTGQRAYARSYSVGALNKMGSAMLFSGGSFVLAP